MSPSRLQIATVEMAEAKRVMGRHWRSKSLYFCVVFGHIGLSSAAYGKAVRPVAMEVQATPCEKWLTARAAGGKRPVRVEAAVHELINSKMPARAGLYDDEAMRRHLNERIDFFCAAKAKTLGDAVVLALQHQPVPVLPPGQKSKPGLAVAVNRKPPFVAGPDEAIASLGMKSEASKERRLALSASNSGHLQASLGPARVTTSQANPMRAGAVKPAGAALSSERKSASSSTNVSKPVSEWAEKFADSERVFTGFSRELLFEAAETSLVGSQPARIMFLDGSAPLSSRSKLPVQDCMLLSLSSSRLYHWTTKYWEVCLNQEGGNQTSMKVRGTTQTVEGLLPQYRPPFKRDIPLLPDAGLTSAQERAFFNQVGSYLQLHRGRESKSAT